jgi:hypothetical protein
MFSSDFSIGGCRNRYKLGGEELIPNQRIVATIDAPLNPPILAAVYTQAIDSGKIAAESPPNPKDAVGALIVFTLIPP